MPRVTYKPEEEMPWKTLAYGYMFEVGKPINVEDPFHLEKFAGNRFFEVEGMHYEPVSASDAAPLVNDPLISEYVWKYPHLTNDEIKERIKTVSGEAPRGRISRKELEERYAAVAGLYEQESLAG